MAGRVRVAGMVVVVAGRVRVAGIVVVTDSSSCS